MNDTRPRHVVLYDLVISWLKAVQLRNRMGDNLLQYIAHPDSVIGEEFAAHAAEYKRITAYLEAVRENVRHESVVRHPPMVPTIKLRVAVDKMLNTRLYT